MTIRIKNWKKFQHYKNRRPPWIKLHREVLDDIEFHEISAEDFRYLIMLWIIASEDKDLEGKLPAIKSLAWRLHISGPEVASLLSRLNKWIICDASDLLADSEQHATPETETEGETDQIKDPPIPPKGGGDPKGFAEFWSAYPRKVGKQVARKAWVRARKNGLGLLSPDEIVEIIEKHKRSESWIKDNGRYIPNPSTWLNQGRWEDVVAPPEPRQSNLTGFSGERYTAAEQLSMRNDDAIRAFLAEGEE